MRPIFLVILLLAGAALAACSGRPYAPAAQSTAAAPSAGSVQPAAPQSEAQAPPEATLRAVAPAAGGSAQGSTNQGGWVSSYPYGTTQGQQSPQTAESGGVTEQGGLTPEVSGWTKPDVTSDQRRADIEACYRYAWAQVDRDMRIDSDVERGSFNDDSGLGFTQLTKRMNLFDYRNRRTTLINSCMESKGYSKG